MACRSSATVLGSVCPCPLETPGLMSFATPSRPCAVPRRTGHVPPSAGRPEPARRPSAPRSCCPLLSPLGEAEGSRGMRLVDAFAAVGLPAADGLATTWLELAQAEPGRLSARPGVYLMTSHVPTSDWHYGQTANCCHRQLRAADACLTAQVARHPRSRISDGMELGGPLRPQALRVRHGYWLAASWRLETRPGRCESSTFDVHGRRWDRWRSRRSASRYELAGELAASPC
jgi:hypothetical protein